MDRPVVCSVVVPVRADADTLPDERWIERLLSALEDNREAVGVTGPGRFYGMPPPSSPQSLPSPISEPMSQPRV